MEKTNTFELKAIQDPSGKSRGRCCRYPSPDKTFTPSPMAGFSVAVKLQFALARLVHGSNTNASPSNSCRA